jgi:PKD repeat protein
MSVKVLLDSWLLERRNIHSGRIYRNGLPPEYGVIFTANESKSEDDLGLDPDLIFNAFIGKKEDPVTEKYLFFEILGGYFYHDNYPDPGITTNVFGIVLNPEFGVIENGTITLKDNWNLDDPERPILDESYWSKRYGKNHGWTFVVTLKEMEKYPTSDDELKIFVYCPEILNVSIEIGGCEYDPQDDRLKRNVTFRASIGEEKSKKWVWHFGDGKSESGTAAPPESIEHLYDVKPGSAPRLCLEGHTACEEICKEVNLSEFDTFKTCPRCPKIKKIQLTFGECRTEGEIRRRKVTFNPLIEGDEPDNWIWHFGDGSTENGDGMPPDTIDHFYEKRPTNVPKLCLIGPSPCEEVCKEVDLSGFEECPPCPQTIKLNHEFTAKDENTQSVKFTVVVSGGAPEKYEWNWGDSSPNETTTELTASHDYELLTTGMANYTVTVTCFGPEDCTDSAQTTIEIPAKVICPEIKGIEVIFGECKTEGEIRRRKVTFNPLIEGDKPDSWIWNFGDGSTENGDGMPPDTIEHFYEKRPIDVPKLCLIGPNPCEEVCKEVDLSEFEECPPCPQTIRLNHEFTAKDENTQLVKFTVVVSGGTPEKYEWDWGDGSPKETTTKPTASHDYELLTTGPANYTVTVTSFGPEDCTDSAQTTIEIPVKVMCPEIKGIEVTFGECKTEGEIRRRKVTFTPLIEGDEPDNWIWHFGDGSTENGNGMLPDTIDHFYEKRPTDVPKLCLIGPSPCEEVCKEVDLSGFEECPPCPRVTSIDHVQTEKDENTQSVKFTLVISGRTPQKYEWDWGDGSPKETTTEPTASHDYKMLITGPEKYSVSVSSAGPEDCMKFNETTIKIPGKKVPEIPKCCFILPLIVAFLMATTLGALITYNAAKICRPELNFEWLVPAVILLAIFSSLAIMFWYRITKRTSCPEPSNCDWIGICWIIFLTGMLVALYLKSCCDAWMWIIVLVFLVVAALLLYTWIKKCMIEIKRFVLHLIVCLLATGCVYWLFASRLFEQ